jgi:hypothetical protein
MMTYQSLRNLLFLICITTLSLQAVAGTPARFYWKGLTGSKAVPIMDMRMTGNANLADPSHMVIPDANFEAHITIAGFAQTLPIAERAAMVAVLFPMGNVSGEGNVLGNSFNEAASGFGDPMVEFNINVIGPKAIKNIPEYIRYEPGFSLDVIVDVAFPIGEYDNTQSINIGQNRWYGRVGTPIVWQLGPWISSQRTTLEFLPSIWLFSDNDDFVGRTLSTEPIFELDAHLTHDFHKDLWGAIDMTWVTGGKATLDGVSGDELDMLSAGFTVGYHINENLQFTTGYTASINDSDPTDLRMDTFMMSLVFGWHPLIDGMNRLKSE